MLVFGAVRLRSPAEKFEVKEKNRGTPPDGFTIGKSARNVALAAAGNVLNTCATTFGAVIVNSLPFCRTTAVIIRALICFQAR
jgi:hypothetical protein